MLNMVNLLGQQVFKQKFQVSTKIEVTDYKKGLYFVEIINSVTSEKTVKKVVVD